MTISRRIGFAAPPEKRPTGWKWDEMIWTKEQERHQSVIPTLMDPDISLIPEDLWRSGIGDGEDLRIINVVEDPHAGTPWYPVIKPGYYHLAWEQFYLFSPNSLIAFGGEETHSVWTNLTKVDLFWPPKPGEPIVVSFMHRREDGDVRDIDNFRHRVRFTGGTVIETDQYGDLVSKTEAVDLDSEGNVVDYNIANLPVNPEPKPLEFVVIQRPEAFTKEWIPSNHVVGQGTGLLGVVTLGATPVYGPPVAFSNMNLFTDYVHDDTPVNPGEYSIGYAGSVNITEGTVEVMTELDKDQIPGYVTYWTDFPATLLFNDYYVSRRGIDTAGPVEYEAAISGDYIGKSRMLPNQSFYLSHFPVLDPEEVRVFVYDPRPAAMTAVEWMRVDDLGTQAPDAEVFSISPDGGFILFGDGIRGKIPHRYAHISAHYRYIPLVEYMPDESILAIIPENINLQPLNNSVHRGFIFLGHKEPIVDQLVLVTNRPRVPDRPDTYGPIDAGNDFALLTCTAFTNEGDVVPEQELTWTLVPPLGYINGTNPYYTPVRTVTDQSGRSRVTYTPVRTAGDMGVIVNLFEGDNSPTGNIIKTYQDNDTLILDEDVEGSVDDMWVFMVTNDDPMLPYDSARREGGRYVVLYRWDEDFYSPTSGEWVPVRPSQIVGTKRLLFDYSIPSPTDTPSLVQYAVLMDRVVNVNATTMNPVTGVQIISNDLKLFIRIPASQRGVFTLSGDTPDGSALDSAAYLSIARDGAMRFVFTGGTTSSTTSSTSSTTTTTDTGTSTSSSTASTSSTTASTASTSSTSSSTSTTATASTTSSTASTSSTTASTASTSSSTSTTGSTSSSSSSSSTTSTTATAEIYCMFNNDFFEETGFEHLYNDLEIRGTDLYVKARRGILKMDITNPALPTYTTKVEDLSVSDANNMHFFGNYAYTMEGANDLINIWNWNTMTHLGSYNTAPPFGFSFFSSQQSAGLDSYVAGNYLYVVDSGNGRLVILDISVPATPSFVTAYAPGADFAFIKALKLDWPILYVGSLNTLTAIDVSNPLSISVVDQIVDARFYHHNDMKLDLATNTLWVASQTDTPVPIFEHLTAIDITTPASMSIVGNVNFERDSSRDINVMDIVSNDTIFLGRLDTFRFDISDRTNPTDITPSGPWYKTCSSGSLDPRGLLVNGDYIYTCDYAWLEGYISVYYISP